MHRKQGKVVEWSITAVLKTAVLRGTGGSNPSLSATQKRVRNSELFLFMLQGRDSLLTRTWRVNKISDEAMPNHFFVLFGCLRQDMGSRAYASNPSLFLQGCPWQRLGKFILTLILLFSFLFVPLCRQKKTKVN